MTMLIVTSFSIWLRLIFWQLRTTKTLQRRSDWPAKKSLNSERNWLKMWVFSDLITSWEWWRKCWEKFPLLIQMATSKNSDYWRNLKELKDWEDLTVKEVSGARPLLAKVKVVFQAIRAWVERQMVPLPEEVQIVIKKTKESKKILMIWTIIITIKRTCCLNWIKSLRIWRQRSLQRETQEFMRYKSCKCSTKKMMNPMLKHKLMMLLATGKHPLMPLKMFTIDQWFEVWFINIHLLHLCEILKPLRFKVVISFTFTYHF